MDKPMLLGRFLRRLMLVLWILICNVYLGGRHDTALVDEDKTGVLETEFGLSVQWAFDHLTSGPFVPRSSLRDIVLLNGVI
jgi:hypothetical protein